VGLNQGFNLCTSERDTLLQREAVIKVLAAQGLGTEGRAHLLQEARAAAGLKYPNIVVVNDAGEHQEIPYIVMEHLPNNC